MATRDKIRADKTKKKENAARIKVKRQIDKRGKLPRFLTVKMWVHYVLSLFQKNRGRIPENIGDRMIVTNNIYITRYYMSSVIHVVELSLDTPFTFVGEIARYLRKKNCDAIVDVTFKNSPFEVQLKDAGLGSRIIAWENTADDPSASNRMKEVAARCLYTVELAKKHERLMQTRCFITLRAKTGSALTRAEKLCYEFLDTIGAEYNQVSNNLKETMMYMSMMSDYRDNSTKNIKAIITSERTLSQMLPNSGSYNGDNGLYVGVDVLNNSIFNLDFKEITKARNIYVYAPSGEGKTVLVSNLCASGVENGYAVCVMDIKGNEFTNFIRATNGYVVSLRQNSSGFINSWRMHKEDCKPQNAGQYYKQRVAFSKEQMIILSGLTREEDISDLDELLDDFHESFYLSIGVLPENQNSWRATEKLTPFEVYEALVSYLTAEVISKYPGVSKKILNNLRMTMSRNGSKSYIFTEEFNYADILKSDTIMFDFGILENSMELNDPSIFRLKFAYMRRLNAEFIAYKYANGIKVLKVLEESQIVTGDPALMKDYVEEITLRRAQGQTTLILGNSITALTENDHSKSIIENITGLFLGRMEIEARRAAIEKFELGAYEDLMDYMNKHDEYANSFLFINKMQSRPSIPVVKVILKPRKEYKLFTPVAQSNSFIE